MSIVFLIYFKNEYVINDDSYLNVADVVWCLSCHILELKVSSRQKKVFAVLIARKALRSIGYGDQDITNTQFLFLRGSWVSVYTDAPNNSNF